MATMHTHPKFSVVNGTPRDNQDAQRAASPKDEGAAAQARSSRRWLERLAERYGRPRLQILAKQRDAVAAELRRIPDRMQRVTNQARLLLELSDDFRNGSYRDISWLSIAAAAACLVYAVSPSDVVPDIIPAIGHLDDMIVLTIAVRYLERDLKRYIRHKGYAESEYFDVRE